MKTIKEMKATVRKLNDEFRRSIFAPQENLLFITPMVSALMAQDQFSLLSKVQCFEDFDADNDPHEEHDFGKVVHNGEAYFWKIDYHDKNDLDNMSEDPTNPDITIRILTVMHATEY